MRKLVRNTLLVLTSTVILLVAYLWLTFVSPFGYQLSDDVPQVDENASYTVFVYGTLQQPWLRWLIMGRAGSAVPAVLPGYQKQALDIQPKPGASTRGLVLTVSGKELKALDRYERLGVRYTRVKVTLENGDTAWAYRLIDSKLHINL